MKMALLKEADPQTTVDGRQPTADSGHEGKMMMKMPSCRMSAVSRQPSAVDLPSMKAFSSRPNIEGLKACLKTCSIKKLKMINSCIVLLI